LVVKLLPRGKGGRTQKVKIIDDETLLPALSMLHGRKQPGHVEQFGAGHRLGGHHHRPARWS
jgi:hypothetical protein